MLIDYLANQVGYIEELAKIQYAEWSHLNPNESLEGRIKRIHSYCNKDRVPCMFVSFDNGNLIGSAGLVINDMSTHTEYSPWLASVIVKPEYRRKGYATEMIKRVELEAKKLNHKTIFLYTPDAEKLYEKLGWQIIRQTTYMNEKVTLMVKNI
jgi:N-acetylglutamate synthase-like GNAT family acetyltransferase